MKCEVALELRETILISLLLHLLSFFFLSLATKAYLYERQMLVKFSATIPGRLGEEAAYIWTPRIWGRILHTAGMRISRTTACNGA